MSIASLPSDQAPVFEQKRTVNRTLVLPILTVLTLLGVAAGLYFALAYVGTDKVQGNVQRIFYIHMPAFFGAFVAFGAAVLGGFMYLRTRNAKWDTLGLAGIEVGFMLALINITTGMIWSRPIWNTWWTWDPRLTLEALMILSYAAYFVLRAGVENVETRRRFAAVYGMLAFTTVILTLVIVRTTAATIHPVVVGGESGEGAFSLNATPGVGAALGVNMLVWGVLVPVTLTWYRVRLQNRAEKIAAIKAELLTK
jgi:heme exporter protein C